jgi:hypothetical protein
MAEQRPGLLAVDTGLVIQTLVERVVDRVEARREERPPEAIAAVLEGIDSQLAGGEDPALVASLAHGGYLCRVVELEFFEPANETADWIPGMLRERFAGTASWPDAVAGTCADLARSEPLGKPSPDDKAAMTWRVPGPGGHVRHYVARRTIEEHLRGRETPTVGDPAELKRLWLYGFFVRACEEALPPEASLDGGS